MFFFLLHHPHLTNQILKLKSAVAFSHMVKHFINQLQLLDLTILKTP